MIKAIETRYNGYRFRSRTEARWAVFFDAAGIRYEYEKEGYELPSGRYLPDFWLPDVDGGVWFEVKGEPPTSSELKAALQLAKATGREVWVASGPVDFVEHAISRVHPHLKRCGLPEGPFGWGWKISLATFFNDGVHDDSVWVGSVNGCVRVVGEKFCEALPPSLMKFGLLRRAFDAAKSARFEFGESGALAA